MKRQVPSRESLLSWLVGLAVCILLSSWMEKQSKKSNAGLGAHTGMLVLGPDAVQL